MTRPVESAAAAALHQARDGDRDGVFRTLARLRDRDLAELRLAAALLASFTVQLQHIREQQNRERIRRAG